MKPFNQANKLIHELLASECIFDIDLYDIKINDCLYKSSYPLLIPKQDGLNTYYFSIKIYKWKSSTQSLKLISLQYKSAPNKQILYVSNPNLDDSFNQFGKKFIENTEFLNRVKPLIIEGFREVVFNTLTK